MLALLVDLPPYMSKATSALAASGLSYRVVAGVLINDESSLRIAEYLLRDAAAASVRVAIDDELGGDEGPEIAAPLVILLAHAGLVCMHIRRARNERERGGVERLQLARSTMDQVAHRAPPHRDAQIAIALLETM